MGPTGVTEPGRIGLIEVVAGIEHLIAKKAIDIAMELLRTGFSGNQDAARCTFSVQSAVVSGEHLHILDRVDTRIDHQRFPLSAAGVDTGVENIAAIDLDLSLNATHRHRGIEDVSLPSRQRNDLTSMYCQIHPPPL